MRTVIGIDIGGSTTKIVGFRSEENKRTLFEPMFVRATDAITSVYGAFGKFTMENDIPLSKIDRVLMTGVGSSFIDKPIYSLNCEKISEFECVGRGGLYLSGLDDAIVVSMGTGTALIHASRDGENIKTEYLGGTGVGGGTLVGLSKLLLRAESIEHIEEYALSGDLGKIDLRIKDMTADGTLSVLSRDLTAANFANVSDIAGKEDIAKGILNLVFETIGMVSVFAAHQAGVDNIILTGNLTRLAFCKEKYAEFNNLKANYGVNFVIPKNAEFATVIGAALEGI